MDAYLRGVGRAELDDLDPPEYVTHRGGAPGAAHAERLGGLGLGPATRRRPGTWRAGDRSVVSMNADGSRRVVVEADVGAKVGWDLWAGVGLFVVGLAVVGGGGLMIAAAERRPSREQ